MLKAKSYQLKAIQGFTLVELLVTISIIGVLASITVVSVGNVRQIARDSKRLADIRQVQTALEFYFNQTNGYPLAANGITLGDATHTVLCVTPNTNDGFVDKVESCAGQGAGPIYMSRVPANATPGGNPAGYLYTSIIDQNNNRKASTYTIEFQLETDIAGFSRNTIYLATPAGIRKSQ